MELSLLKGDEDHIAGKGDNSRNHSNLVHKFIPNAASSGIPDAGAAVEKERKNSKRSKLGSWIRSRAKKGGYSESTKGQNQTSLCCVDEVVSS